MVANSVKRREFDDLIVSFTGPRCDYSPTKTAVVWFPAAGANFPSGRIGLRVAKVAEQAFRALAAVMLHHGYAFEETAGGTLNCRYIGGTSTTSFHAHGIAGDWNPSRNAYRRHVGPIQWGRQTDMPEAMVRAIEAIRTVSGHQVFEWGGRWYSIKDPMHYELDLYRSQLNTGINLATLPAGAWARYQTFEAGGNPIGEEQMLDRNTKSPSAAVAMFQRNLIHIGYDLGAHTPIQPSLYPPGADGDFGTDTENGAKAFQTDMGIQVTGRGDALTVALAADLARFSEHSRRTGGKIKPESGVDEAARAAAKAAQAAADKANRTLDKIRSE